MIVLSCVLLYLVVKKRFLIFSGHYLAMCLLQIRPGSVLCGGQYSASADWRPGEEAGAESRPDGDQEEWPLLAHTHTDVSHRPRLARLHESQPLTSETQTHSNNLEILVLNYVPYIALFKKHMERVNTMYPLQKVLSGMLSSRLQLQKDELL